MNINIGLNEQAREIIATGLGHLLADSYLLYVKTQNFHWNVKGPYFQTLHLLFEGFYTELAQSIDVIAERIRALGFPAPGSYAQFSKLSNIKEEESVPIASVMVQQLLDDQELIINLCSGLLPEVQAAGDEPTADLLIERMQVHEKNAWMLRSFLEE